MENYIVSARKYRPSTFMSVVGQKALTQTLKSAISNNKLAHAYLFCGPRGVGKTSCARIFAKTINCLAPTATGDACNKCESCVAFNEQRSYNIHELDAASNNSVEDIRELCAQVQIPPQIGKYKVYIVDEVHMLSASAFNAFLKTLEEPPHHALFILATTEKHKILPTILSRCQIYDFNRISQKDTVDHLLYVAKQEGIEADPKALGIIAHKADGGMRDALSIFDQIASFTGGSITYEAVLENLNILDYEYYFKICNTFLSNSVHEALLILNDIIGKGFDAQHFISGLSSHLREVMVSKDPITLSLVEAGEDIAKRYQQQAEMCSNPFLYKAIEIANECDLNYRASRNKRLLVEIALIRICQLTLPQPAVLGNVVSGVSIQPIQPINGTPQYSEPTKAAATQAPQSNYEVQVTNTPVTAQTAAQTVEPIVVNRAYAKQPAPAEQKPTTKPGLPGLNRISIRGGGETTVESNGSKTEEIQPVSQKMNEKIDENRLEEVWIAFTQNIPSEAILVNTILACKPKLISETEFEVIVENRDQIDRINEKGSDLLSYMRTNLRNSKLTMKLSKREKNEQQKAFSQREKYEAMLKENPNLKLLTDTFNLMLD